MRTGIEGSPSGSSGAGTADESVPQENIKVQYYCAHRGHGCISQNGYLCFNGEKCEPVDAQGRRFVVFEWLENGQPLAHRHYLDDVNGVPLRRARA